jgi:hypothetical protein
MADPVAAGIVEMALNPKTPTKYALRAIAQVLDRARVVGAGVAAAEKQAKGEQDGLKLWYEFEEIHRRYSSEGDAGQKAESLRNTEPGVSGTRVLDRPRIGAAVEKQTENPARVDEVIEDSVSAGEPSQNKSRSFREGVDLRGTSKR